MEMMENYKIGESYVLESIGWTNVLLNKYTEYLPVTLKYGWDICVKKALEQCGSVFSKGLTVYFLN